MVDRLIPSATPKFGQQQHIRLTESCQAERPRYNQTSGDEVLLSAVMCAAGARHLGLLCSSVPTTWDFCCRQCAQQSSVLDQMS